jgi:hypothetical protein
LIFAFFPGIPAEALKIKASATIQPSCQQSYPQKLWMAAKAL